MQIQWEGTWGLDRKRRRWGGGDDVLLCKILCMRVRLCAHRLLAAERHELGHYVAPIFIHHFVCVLQIVVGVCECTCVSEGIPARLTPPVNLNHRRTAVVSICLSCSGSINSLLFLHNR